MRVCGRVDFFVLFLVTLVHPDCIDSYVYVYNRVRVCERVEYFFWGRSSPADGIDYMYVRIEWCVCGYSATVHITRKKCTVLQYPSIKTCVYALNGVFA